MARVGLMARLRKIRGKTWVVVGAVIALVGGGGVALASAHAGGDSAQSSASATQIVSATTQTIQQSVEATGTLAPTVEETVSFLASGTVQTVDVAEGDTVAIGQTLATIDTLQANAALLSAKATLAEAESKLASAVADDDGTTTADAEIASLQAEVTVEQAAVDTAQTAMAGTTLTAPFTGLVTSVGIEVGDAVTGTSSSSGSSKSSSSSGGSSASTGSSSSGGSASSSSSSSGSTSSSSASGQFTIVGTDSWTVSVSLGETEIGLIAVGDSVNITTDDDVTTTGTVSAVGALPSTTSGSAEYPVTITVAGGVDGLYDGISVTADIVYESRDDVLVIPSAAVTTAADGTSTVTLVADDGTETPTTVTLGETSADMVEITGGLSEGDKVVETLFTAATTGTDSDEDGQDSRDQQNQQDQMGGPGGGDMGGQMPGGGNGQMPGGGNGGGN